MRSRAFRRHQTDRHMRRRLTEDRNQHYNDLTCLCWTSPGHMARFKEQPKTQQCYCCSSPRYNHWLAKPERLTMQERRFQLHGKADGENEPDEEITFDWWDWVESNQYWRWYSEVSGADTDS